MHCYVVSIYYLSIYKCSTHLHIRWAEDQEVVLLLLFMVHIQLDHPGLSYAVEGHDAIGRPLPTDELASLYQGLGIITYPGLTQLIHIHLPPTHHKDNNHHINPPILHPSFTHSYTKSLTALGQPFFFMTQATGSQYRSPGTSAPSFSIILTRSCPATRRDREDNKQQTSE